MPEKKCHLNGSQGSGEKGCFWTPKMEFSGFPDFGLCREGREGRNKTAKAKPEIVSHKHRSRSCTKMSSFEQRLAASAPARR